MRKRYVLLFTQILAMVLVLVLFFGVFTDAKATPHFQGKAITLAVPTSAGGGTDIWGRMIARHLCK